MKRAKGRCIYIVDLAHVIGVTPRTVFVKACRDMHLDAIWIRLGRGTTPSPNLNVPHLAELKAELGKNGVEIWGWHVPFCADLAAAKHEAALVVAWMQSSGVDGVIVDAERTPESPRFRGGPAEAEAYCTLLGDALRESGKGFAFSSHDQPEGHRDMPFAPFLDAIPDVCPQVYYKTPAVDPRLKKSIDQYRALIGAAPFQDRYKPTGNITIGGDVGFKSAADCVKATHTFIASTKANGFSSYSFWCWDETTAEILAALKEIPA